MDLESVSGVGSKTADALTELDDPERALREGDVAELARAPWISEGEPPASPARPSGTTTTTGAGSWRPTAPANSTGTRSTSFRTAPSPTTPPNGWRRSTRVPCPGASRGSASSPNERWTASPTRTCWPLWRPSNRSSNPVTSASGTGAWRRATPNATPRPSPRFPRFQSKSSTTPVSSPSFARSYATVVALDESFAGVEVEGDVRVEPDALESPADVVPERPLAFFARNRDRLQAAAEVHRTASLEPACDLDALESALDRLNEDGSVRDDSELDRLSTAVDDLDAAVSTAESAANDHLREAIEEQDVTIEGTDLLSLVERGAGVDSLLSGNWPTSTARRREGPRPPRRRARPPGRRSDGPAGVPRRPTYPVEHDEECGLAPARGTDHRARPPGGQPALKREVASDLAGLRGTPNHWSTPPSNSTWNWPSPASPRTSPVRCRTSAGWTGEPEDEPGFAIEGGRSPLLDVPFEDVDPVDYRVEGWLSSRGQQRGRPPPWTWWRW